MDHLKYIGGAVRRDSPARLAALPTSGERNLGNDTTLEVALLAMPACLSARIDGLYR